MSVDEESDVEKKGGTIKAFAIALGVVTLLAIGGGWVIGTQLMPTEVKQTAEAVGGEEDDKKEALKIKPSIASNDDVEKSAIELDPILVELKGEKEVWLRLQLVVTGNADFELGEPIIKAKIGSDIIALVKTLRLEQISGPSGLLHLKEDLLDRAKLTTDGQVEDLMIMSIIAE